jgi:hypothetical protein
MHPDPDIDPEIHDAIRELHEHRAARVELERRREVGHQASCQCQSRHGRSCRELRRIVGWRVVAEVFATR